MSIPMEFNGVKFVCETPAEAAALALALTAGTSSSAPSNGAPKATGLQRVQAIIANGEAFDDFMGAIDKKGRILLGLAVKAAPDPVVAEDLVGPVGVADLNELGWVRRKLKLIAATNSLDLDKLLEPVKVLVHGKPKTAYKATPRLVRKLSAADE